MLRIYDFKCAYCGTVREELVQHDVRQVAGCKECSGAMHRVISPVNFECGKGLDPDFPTAYAQWGKKRNDPKYKPHQD